MNKILNQIQKLCSPARLYFIISVISFLGMFLQNCQDSSSYNIGTYSVDSPCHNGIFFLAKAGYIIIWTYLLNLLCNKGFKTVSWALVLLPFVGMFIAIGLLMFLLLKRENFEDQMMEEDEEDEDEESPMDMGMGVGDDGSSMEMGEEDPIDMDPEMTGEGGDDLMGAGDMTGEDDLMGADDDLMGADDDLMGADDDLMGADDMTGEDEMDMMGLGEMDTETRDEGFKSGGQWGRVGDLL